LDVSATTSFKHISCGDGGACITDDDDLARKLRLAGDKCYDRSPGALDRNATFLANNYRMTELQAAVAIAQLAKLDSIIARRRSWCGRLHERLSRIARIDAAEITPAASTRGVLHAFAWSGLKHSARRSNPMACPAGAHYIGKPIHEYPLFQDHSAFRTRRASVLAMGLFKRAHTRRQRDSRHNA